MSGFGTSASYKCTLQIILICFFVITILPDLSQAEENVAIHHDLKVVIDPENHHIDVKDTVTIHKRQSEEMQFFLHGGFNPSSINSNVHIVREKEETLGILVEFFRVKLPHHLKTFILRYSGNINYPVESVGKEQARGFKTTIGIISNEGVYLSGSSYWYPVFDEGMVSFNLEVELPSGWDAVSQGERTIHKKEKDKTIVKWKSPEPQEEIFLVAGKFIEYIKIGKVTAMVFLRTPDKELADRYLDATERYISMYERLIGPYPYKKFALVENFWETGSGMPSFTLLGPKIIRFPFIINTSYPHEILHNWWGNSVFPHPDSGNWSEGLTAYLSDHLLKEQQGNDVEYRQETLQKYTDYVLSGRDFPLTEFRFRYSSPSEAIGYGKSLMFFHMLRQEVGDKIFIAGLQDFYKLNKFKFASFDDLKKSFEKVSRRTLKVEFDQWIKRKGAPKLRLSNVKVKRERDVFVLTAIIEQVQEGNAYHLRIPIVITMEGQEKARQIIFDMNKKYDEVTMKLPHRPLRIDVDPEFDLFRRLDRNEIPPALSQALGAKKMLVILPSHADDTMLKAYQELSEGIRRSGPDEIEIKFDKEVTKIPSDSAVTILGWENSFFNKMISELFQYEVMNEQKELIIGKFRITKERHSIVLTGWNPSNKDMAFVLIATDIPGALSGLGRKIPHYHKYSYLVFEGVEPENIVKERWQVINSPMTVFLPDEEGNITKVEMGRLDKKEGFYYFLKDTGKRLK
ncbi:MAG: M1 family metallopeptidase [Thermodesulfovibrionales bacterium]